MGKLINFDWKDNEVIEKLRVVCDVSPSDIIKVYEAFCFYMALEITEGESIRVPYCGDIKVEGDTFDFSPHTNLKNIRDQLVKAEKSGKVLDINIIKLIQEQIAKTLKNNDVLKTEI
jgi:hypothetical protein